MSENKNITATKVDQFKGILNQQTIRAQLRNTLHDNAGAFMSSMIDLYESDNSLQGCDPQAVAMECMKAASLKLPLVKSLGFAYVVPFRHNNKPAPTFVIGYKGLIQLAQHTRQYKTINSGTVYEGEFVSRDKLSGTVDLSGERTSDKVVGYFAYFQLLNGFEKTLYMSRGEVETWAKRYSPSYSSSYSPWQKEFDKMAEKTCMRRLISTYGPMSVEMNKALEKDDRGVTPQQEAKKKANKQMIDINPETGEVINDAVPAPHEPSKAKKDKPTPPPEKSQPAAYDPGF
jgi:recombination protein RecT